MTSSKLRIGVDIGGTFTDFVIFNPATGSLTTRKVPSTPSDPAEAVLKGLDAIRNENGNLEMGREEIVHGSTVATNALLERKGSSCAFIATRGFKHLLQIGRQTRPALYDLFADPPEPLVPIDMCFEVDERVDYKGDVLHPLEPEQVNRLIKELRQVEVKSVAVCLLFSFLHPEHELRIAKALRSEGFFVSASVDILPEFREYERASTTAVNAFVSPVMDRYLSRLSSELAGELRVMKSNGGCMGVEEARRSGVNCILSGPAGGVVGAAALLDILDDPLSNRLKMITFDMGGTSTDVSLVEGEPQLTFEAEVGGCPIHIPVLDIHTIGAGGGSIATIDAGGALRVGPQSAGAEPGPACYGRGNLPTVTDANLVLGRLLPEFFLGGDLHLDAQRSLQVFSALGESMGLDPVSTAMGVVDVTNAHMERALRLISVERGHDPRDFVLFSFGGAGGLHAVDLARRLGVSRVLISPLASTLSAFGMLAADVIRDYVQTVMLPGDTAYGQLQELFERLQQEGIEEVIQEGVPEQNVRCEPSLDMRLSGQSYELTVPFDEQFLSSFHRSHEQAYGYSRPDAGVEIVNLRLRVRGIMEKPRLMEFSYAGVDASRAVVSSKPVVYRRGSNLDWLEAVIYQGEMLQAGNHLAGPAVVVYKDTTILLEPGDAGEVDRFGNLWLEVAAK